MKKIVIIQWLKFVNTNKPKDLKVDPVYRIGYWNVMHHNQELEKFLTENEIKYKVTDQAFL